MDIIDHQFKTTKFRTLSFDMRPSNLEYIKTAPLILCFLKTTKMEAVVLHIKTKVIIHANDLKYGNTRSNKNDVLKSVFFISHILYLQIRLLI